MNGRTFSQQSSQARKSHCKVVVWPASISTPICSCSICPVRTWKQTSDAFCYHMCPIIMLFCGVLQFPGLSMLHLSRESVKTDEWRFLPSHVSDHYVVVWTASVSRAVPAKCAPERIKRASDFFPLHCNWSLYQNTQKVKKNSFFSKVGNTKQRVNFWGRPLSQPNKGTNTTVTMITMGMKRLKKNKKT